MCSGGGSGNSGTQRYEWNETLAPQWADTLSYGRSLRDRPYERYTGQRIADLNSTQTGAMDMITNLATGRGTDATRAAGNQATATLSGHYLDEGANPWAGVSNPWREVQTETSRNEYAGDNPFFRQSLNSELEDITGAYQRGTSADTTRMFNLAGAFGGSAHQNAMANNQSALARQLANTANQRYEGQFDRSSGLEENFLNRDLQNQQYMRSSGSQMDENTINRGFSGFEGERGRMLGALGAGQNDQALALQRMQAMLGVGDMYRGFNQDHINQNFADWQEGQNYPYRQLDMFSGLLSRAQGGMSPNMSYTSPGYGASPLSSVLGAGLLGYGMFGG